MGPPINALAHADTRASSPRHRHAHTCTHTAHTRVHTRSHSPVLGRCAERSGMGRVARGLPPGSAGLGSRAPRGPCPPSGRWQSVSWESVNTPPAAAQRRPQWPGTAAADSAFRRALRLTPPQPGPSVIPLRLEGSRRGGAGRGEPTCRGLRQGSGCGATGRRGGAARAPGPALTRHPQCSHS